MSIQGRPYTLPPSAAAVEEQLNALYDAGHQAFLEEIIERPWLKPALKISVTNRCNLRCAYCYDNEYQPPFQPCADMDVDFVEEIFERYPDPSYVFVLGGEPLLNPEPVLAILRRCPSRVVISTNGQVFNHDVERVLRCISHRAESGRATLLQVSSEEGGNTRERGTKNAEAILIKFAEACACPMKVKYTMTGPDVASIERIASWYWDRKLPVQFDYADGGFGAGSKTDLSAEDFAGVFEFMRKALTNSYEESVRSDSDDWPLVRIGILLQAVLLRTTMLFFNRRPCFSACGVLGHSVYIGPTGEVAPCHRWKQHRYGSWNSDIDNLGKRIREFHAQVGPAIGSRCTGCQWRGSCGRVCPAVMYNFENDALLGRCKFLGTQRDAVFAFLTDKKLRGTAVMRSFLERTLSHLHSGVQWERRPL